MSDMRLTVGKCIYFSLRSQLAAKNSCRFPKNMYRTVADVVLRPARFVRVPLTTDCHAYAFFTHCEKKQLKDLFV